MYFDLYKFALGIGTDPVIAVIAFHRCAEVDWSRMTVRDGFVTQGLQIRDVIGFEKETVQSSTRMRGSDDVPTPITLSAVLVYFRADILRVSLETVWRGYNVYRSLADEPGETRGRDSAEGMDSDALIEEDLFRTRAGESGNMTEEALAVIRSHAKAVGHDMPVLTKRYLKLVRALIHTVQTALHGSDTILGSCMCRRKRL